MSFDLLIKFYFVFLPVVFPNAKINTDFFSFNFYFYCLEFGHSIVSFFRNPNIVPDFARYAACHAY